MNKATDTLFRVGLIVKAIDSIFEILGGVILTMPTKLARYILVLSQHEVYRHHHVLAGRLDRLADNVETHASMGEAVYLVIHGLAKFILIAAIFRGKRWGYIGCIVVLSFFTLIEMSRVVTAHEVVTGLLGLFDIFIVYLIYKEYRAKFLTPEPTEPTGASPDESPSAPN